MDTDRNPLEMPLSFERLQTLATHFREGGEFFFEDEDGAELAESIEMLLDDRRELRRIQQENRYLSTENENLWKQKSHLTAKLSSIIGTFCVPGAALRPIRVTEWGPGEGDIVNVPVPDPQRIHEIFSELEDLRRKVKNAGI